MIRPALHNLIMAGGLSHIKKQHHSCIEALITQRKTSIKDTVHRLVVDELEHFVRHVHVFCEWSDSRTRLHSGYAPTAPLEAGRALDTDQQYDIQFVDNCLGLDPGCCQTISAWWFEKAAVLQSVASRTDLGKSIHQLTCDRPLTKATQLQKTWREFALNCKVLSHSANNGGMISARQEQEQRSCNWFQVSNCLEAVQRDRPRSNMAAKMFLTMHLQISLLNLSPMTTRRRQSMAYRVNGLKMMLPHATGR